MGPPVPTAYARAQRGPACVVAMAWSPWTRAKSAIWGLPMAAVLTEAARRNVSLVPSAAMAKSTAPPTTLRRVMTASTMAPTGRAARVAPRRRAAVMASYKRTGASNANRPHPTTLNARPLVDCLAGAVMEWSRPTNSATPVSITTTGPTAVAPHLVNLRRIVVTASRMAPSNVTMAYSMARTVPALHSASLPPTAATAWRTRLRNVMRGPTMVLVPALVQKHAGGQS